MERVPQETPVQKKDAKPESAPAPKTDKKTQLKGHGYAEQSAMLAPDAAPVQKKEGSGSILLSFDRVEEVWASWVRNLAPQMRLPEDDPKVMQAAGRRTKNQVGSLNHANWVKEGGGSVWIGPVTVRPMTEDEKKQAGIGQKDAEPELDLTPTGTYNRLCDVVSKYNKISNDLNRAVVAVEYEAHKLKSPEGAQGVAYQIAAGGMGLMYGVGAQAAHYAKEKANPVGQIAEEVVGVKDGPTIEEKGGELAETAETSIDVLTGKLHGFWQQTRPSYNAFQSALTSFGNARSLFYKCDYLDLAGLVAQVDAMKAALKAMMAAGKEYQNTCVALGIHEKAMKVDRLGAAIQAGMTNAVEFAVDALGGEAAGGKAVEVALEVGKAGAKKATE